MFGFLKCKKGFAVWAMALSVCAIAQETGQPSAAEQEKLLATMREYAEQYISNLPNFLCSQVTEQFQSGRKADRWRRGDTLTSRLVFNHGRENRTLELVNGQPTRGRVRPWRIPLTTEGEFGILLGQVLGRDGGAQFSWRSWDTIGSRRVAVFDYQVDAEHSTLRLILSDLSHAIIPYRGSIYGDPKTGAVWRITNSSNEIPAELKTKSISTTIYYDEVQIGEASYLLPARATVLVDTGSRNLRNEIRFENYRKFEADSTITYGPGGPKN